MAQNIKLIVYPVQDIEKAKAFYGKFLDAEPYVESAYYVGYRVGDQEVGLDPNSKLGPIAYTDVKDIKSSLQILLLFSSSRRLRNDYPDFLIQSEIFLKYPGYFLLNCLFVSCSEILSNTFPF
jgi:hypothetical protein